MEKIKKHTGFSEKFLKEEKEINAALKKVSKKLIEETKKENGFLIFADENGKPKKVHAKDL